MKSIFILSALGMIGAGLLASCTAIDRSGSGQEGAQTKATKDTPFVNSLGMKFVPVPGTNILMCTTETTVAQYQAAGLGYQAPKFPQGSNHPAVNVSWNDAKAWCAWLSKREGRKFRLPTDAEWTTAVGNNTYPWGYSWPPPNNAGNYAGQEIRSCTDAERSLLYKGFTLIGGFSDRHKFTAPVGSYPANRLGLHDLGGNAWEWSEDSWGVHHIFHGACWSEDARSLLASSCRGGLPGYRDGICGFRVVVVR